MRNYSRKDYSHNWGPPANKYKSKSKSKKNEENKYRVVLNQPTKSIVTMTECTTPNSSEVNKSRSSSTPEKL